jgi:3-hydroxyisobutyrate dehydrogenase-like beta-hydroxyacid dehydrogenase
VIGLLHPGEMGSAVGATLRQSGCRVLWASEGRSGVTADRAEAAGLESAGSARELARRCDVILSICPPHAAREVAASVGDFDGIYVDANAISPATSRDIGERFTCYVDGGIVGAPPRERGAARLYLAGEGAPHVAELFRATALEPVVLDAPIGAASALKMTYAAWTKGSAALLLATRATARAEGVEEALLAEWRVSVPGLEERAARAAASANRKGWRWIAEMEEIAATFDAAGEPDGFHCAAAAVFRGVSEAVEPGKI